MTPLGTQAFLVATAVKGVTFFSLLIGLVALATYAERRIAGFIQDRSGPNRVGPIGLLQALADGVKFIFKEETAPSEANKAFFYLAPMLAIVPATVLFAVIPFAAPLPTRWGLVELIVADAPVGFLYILALSSLGVYGVVMAGWSSNSKYAFLGGLRGSAQMISYEVGLAMSLIPLVLLAGDVRIPEVVSMQQGFAGGGTMGTWFVLPLGLSAFFFLIAGLAETNRLPFDLPEAEAELVAGYHTEYSSMKFSMFFMGEYAHLITTAALVTVFFLGGWDIPFWSGDNIRVLADGTVLGDPAWWKTLVTFLAFSVKTAAVVFLFMWVRWTLPRFRYDQLMDLGWKFFLPVLMAYIVIIAGSIYALDVVGLGPGRESAMALFGLNLLLGGLLLFVVDRGALIGGSRRAVRRAPGTARKRHGGRPGGGGV